MSTSITFPQKVRIKFNNCLRDSVYCSGSGLMITRSSRINILSSPLYTGAPPPPLISSAETWCWNIFWLTVSGVWPLTGGGPVSLVSGHSTGVRSEQHWSVSCNHQQEIFRYFKPLLNLHRPCLYCSQFIILVFAVNANTQTIDNRNVIFRPERGIIIRDQKYSFLWCYDDVKNVVKNDI